MKILFLERTTIQDGRMNFSEIERKGDVVYCDSLVQKDQYEAVSDADFLIINKTKITEEFLCHAPKLKCIFLLATGYNNVDLASANAHNVGVCNVPGYSTDAVAQLTFSFILNFATQTIQYTDSVRAGDWANCSSYTYLTWPIHELNGKTLGIIGYGSIGQKVADIAKAFGMRILVYTRTPKDDSAVKFCSLEELLPASDFVTLHCPLTPETKGMMNRKTIALMKPTAYLINTSRGGAVDEYALADALNTDQIAGAGIDVLETEPMPKDCPYLQAKHILVTPHIAWAAVEARTRLIHEVAENIAAFQSGNRRNRVD